MGPTPEPGHIRTTTSSKYGTNPANGPKPDVHTKLQLPTSNATNGTKHTELTKRTRPIEASHGIKYDTKQHGINKHGTN